MMALHGRAQSKINFEDITLPQALKESQAQNKPVFFMGFASWCGHCKNMKEHVFTIDSVGDYFNQHFVCMMMDMEKGDGIMLAKKFFVTSFPTFVILDSTGTVLYQVVGELDAGGLLREARNSFNRNFQLPYLREQFESNVRDTDKCLKYLFALNHAGMPTMKVAHAYFTSQNNQPPITVMNWRILNAGVSEIQSPEFQYILDHRTEYSAVMTQAKVERKIFRTTAYNLQPLVDKNDTDTYFQKRNLLTGLNIHSLDSLIFNLDLTIYENADHWFAYQSTALQHTADYEWSDYSQLQHMAKQFFNHVTDAAALKQAAGWAKHSSELKPEYANTILYAQLLEKSGDHAGAKEAALHAKQLAAVTNAATPEADQLLQRLAN